MDYRNTMHSPIRNRSTYIRTRVHMVADDGSDMYMHMCLCVIHLFIMSSSIHNQNKKNKKETFKKLVEGLSIHFGSLMLCGRCAPKQLQALMP